MEQHSEIQDFYEGRHVFVTGGTGFVGKALIEKLLRSTKVAMIYMLIREKMGVDIETRLNKLFDEIIFDRVRDDVEGQRRRICVISGDCVLPDLGLSDLDKSILMENVDVAFHVASTTKFTEKLRTAYTINVQGTKTCLELCKAMKHLKAFIYVSTAYSNCVLERIEEKVYEHSFKHEMVEGILQHMNDQEIEEQLPGILGKWPMTYPFTKQLAEGVIKLKADTIPAGIFRPALITNAYKEPYEGWVGISNPVAMAILQMVAGNVKIMRFDPNYYIECVPIDYCVSFLLVSAWDVARKKTTHDVPVYNYVSSAENPITWKMLKALVIKYGHEYPFSKYPNPITIRLLPGRCATIMARSFYHHTPALCLDLSRLVRLQRPRAVRMTNKFHIYNDLLVKFDVGACRFDNSNVVRLWQDLNKTDQMLFAFSIKQIVWSDYVEALIKGLRQYILKDPLETVEEAKKKQRKNLFRQGFLSGAAVSFLILLPCCGLGIILL